MYNNSQSITFARKRFLFLSDGILAFSVGVPLRLCDRREISDK
jgi:hypothetical protein